MSEPKVRDVYFWSKETGLLEFPGVLFAVNARTVRGVSEAEPEARWTATTGPGAEPDPPPGVGTYGLLWSPEQGATRGIPHMIPAVLTRYSATPRGEPDRGTEWDVVVGWRSFGPFVAGGVPLDGAVDRHGAHEPEPART